MPKSEDVNRFLRALIGRNKVDKIHWSDKNALCMVEQNG